MDNHHRLAVFKSLHIMPHKIPKTLEVLRQKLFFEPKNKPYFFVKTRAPAMAKNHFLGLKSGFFGSKSSASLEFQILDL